VSSIAGRTPSSAVAVILDWVHLLRGCCSFAVGCPEGFATAGLMKLRLGHQRSGFGSSTADFGAFGQLYQLGHPITEDSMTARFD